MYQFISILECIDSGRVFSVRTHSIDIVLVLEFGGHFNLYSAECLRYPILSVFALLANSVFDENFSRQRLSQKHSNSACTILLSCECIVARILPWEQYVIGCHKIRQTIWHAFGSKCAKTKAQLFLFLFSSGNKRKIVCKVHCVSFQCHIRIYLEQCCKSLCWTTSWPSFVLHTHFSWNHGTNLFE